MISIYDGWFLPNGIHIISYKRSNQNASKLSQMRKKCVARQIEENLSKNLANLLSLGLNVVDVLPLSPSEASSCIERYKLGKLL
jgi:hypothetical protein